MDKFSALQILKLDGSATRSEAKKAFREMAKTCHPDRYEGRPGAADAEEQMKRLNSAFSLLMKVLPEKETRTDPSGPGPAAAAGSRKSGLFSAFRKRVGGLKRAGGKRRTRPGSAVTPSRPGPSQGRRPKAASPGRASFDRILSGACASPASWPPCSGRVRTSAGDAYSRYVRLKHHMQVQRRRPGQSAVSRVEKISPVRPVQKVGDR